MAPKPHEHSPIEGQLSFLDADHLGVEIPAVLQDRSAAEPSAQPLADVSVELSEDTTSADDDALVLQGPNTRVRAGNAMQRARAGAIRGAIDTLAQRGLVKLTMAEAADRGGLARATLYNHVRDKESLLAMLLEHEAQAVADAFVHAGSLEAGLVLAARMVAEHPALTGIRAHDPATLVRLTASPEAAVRDMAASALEARGILASAANVDLLLRWLASFVVSPSDPATREQQAAALQRMLS